MELELKTLSTLIIKYIDLKQYADGHNKITDYNITAMEPPLNFKHQTT